MSKSSRYVALLRLSLPNLTSLWYDPLTGDENSSLQRGLGTKIRLIAVPQSDKTVDQRRPQLKIGIIKGITQQRDVERAVQLDQRSGIVLE